MKLVILDRDGVINHDSDEYIKSPDEWKPIPGSLEAIARLTQAGYRVVVATNQSGIGRGLFDMATLNAIHDKMHRAVGQAGGRIDAVFFCPHAQDANCDCRKPKPGMLRRSPSASTSSLKGVPCVGDSLRDLQAAAAVGAQPILVLTGKGKKTQREGGLPPGTRRLRRPRRSAVQSFAQMTLLRSCARRCSRCSSSSSPRLTRSSRCCAFRFRALTRYRVISGWSRLMLAGAATICGIRYRVLGAENLPPPPCIVLSKHQSAWETLAFQDIFPPQVWVVKRELLWIPFFGWGLALLSPIAIDRGARRRARCSQLLEQGRERLARGFCIVIFPGRHARRARQPRQVPGRRRLARGARPATPVVPVAHNAGELLAAQRLPQAPGTGDREHRRADRRRGSHARRAQRQGRGLDRERDAAHQQLRVTAVQRNRLIAARYGICRVRARQTPVLIFSRQPCATRSSRFSLPCCSPAAATRARFTCPSRNPKRRSPRPKPRAGAGRQETRR